LIQIKAAAARRSYDVFMDHLDSEAVRARQLRAQADWCISMAAKIADQRYFRAYVDAAVAYQEEASALERRAGPHP
jgi:hypothetical protein